METKVFKAEKKRIWVNVRDNICLAVVIWPFYIFGYNDLPKHLFLPATVFCIIISAVFVILLIISLLDYHTQVESTKERLLIKRWLFCWKINWNKTKGVYCITKYSWVERGRNKKILIIDSGGRVVCFNLGILSVGDEKRLLNEVTIHAFENQIPLL